MASSLNRPGTKVIESADQELDTLVGYGKAPKDSASKTA
jgi:hypothetical protein